jgi:hypothetical protein
MYYYYQHSRLLIIVHVFYCICLFCSYFKNIITIGTAALFHTELRYMIRYFNVRLTNKITQ